MLTKAALVRKEGLEPSRFYPPDPKSGASANSATFASRDLYNLSLVLELLPQVQSQTAGHWVLSTANSRGFLINRRERPATALRRC